MCVTVCGAELPPRARRIRTLNHTTHLAPGTTSACAENTDRLHTGVYVMGNYLRVRGEYDCYRHDCRPLRELPPRARRIQRRKVQYWLLTGTTSACAENTFRDVLVASRKRNYLRVRGEYATLGAPILPQGELPPRARRIPIINKT